MTPVRLLLAALALIGLVLALLFLGGTGRGPRDVEREGQGAEVAPGGTEPPDVVPVPGSEARNELGTRQPPGPDPATSGDVPTLQVSGRVVSARTEEPVAGATVALDAPDDYVTAETDANGRFRMALRADAWRMGETYRASVFRAGNRRLFEGNVVLEPELLIRARLQLLLRGRLVANFDLASVETAVQAHVPPVGSVHVAVYAGRANLDAEGRFEIEAWCDEEPPAFQLTFEALSSRVLIAEVPTSELVSGRGATLYCQVGELSLVVVDGEEQPLPEAAIRVYCEGAGSEDAWFASATHPDGRASLLVPPGRVELCVGREGYSFDHRFLEMSEDLAPQRERIALLALGLDECVTGRVLDADGEPVPDALVSGYPRTEHPEVSVAAHVGVPSDEDGNFLLPIAGNATIEVLAYHERRGTTAPVQLAPTQREVTLRFETAGGLEIDLTGIPTEDGAVADTVQWLLVARGSGRTFSGHAWSVPFEVEEVPEGTYDAYVFLARSGLFAHRSIQVAGDEFQEVSLPAVRVPFVDGTLARADGSPARSCSVHLTETDWPEPVIELWGGTTTDLQGRFRLPLGPSGRGRAVVRDLSGNELGTLELVSGEGTYRLP